MKPIFLLLIILTCSAFLNSQTILLNDDFESYSQGPISSQNSGWTDLSNATADVTWAGGSFSACSSSDVNQAYLSFISGDNIEAGVGLNAVNGQISVEMNVSIILLEIILDKVIINIFSQTQFIHQMKNNYVSNAQ